ncbi:MAG TPA: mechanosensitive ion channel family protein [Oscillatoriales cyanobacterium M59_W2019_021]|nr:mechanosensitive ion channel family protein [Oscillatoriales cyanobacterium M4454_W2019_049]HIK51913.1 mechanosensitive ion channel family protein [Oscillatoriales cyanobacterium M59_W2019_021]
MKKTWRSFLAFILIAFIAVITASPATSQTPSAASDSSSTPTQNIEDRSGEKPTEFPVIIDGKTLFVIRETLGLSSLEERAKAIASSIQKVAADESIALNTLQSVEENGLTIIKAGQTPLISLADADARSTHRSRQELSQEYQETITSAIAQYREQRTSQYLFRAAFYAGMVSIAFLLVGIVLNYTFPRIVDRLNSWRHTILPSIRLQHFELISSDRLADMSIGLLQTVRSLLNLGIAVLYVPIVCQFFPWTRPVSNLFWKYLRSAANLAWGEFVKYLPNLFSVALVIIVTSYILRFIKPIFDGLAKGTISLPGFYPDWATPTYRILEIGIIALAAVIIFPYLPGFGSPAFQSVSVFLGVIFSLGSSAALANAVAGIILIYTRAFQIGDRVKVGDTLGDIEEKLLLVTRIRTSYNVIVTIPNASLLSSNIINYSATIRDTGIPLILSVSVTLSYQIPWRQVHQILIEAALATPNVLDDPPPFVHQTNLGNSWVTYELKVHTDRPNGMAGLYSGLYQNIQDKFSEAGIEIVAPQYSAVRDGNASTLPEEYLSPDYQPSGFQLHPLGNLFQIDLNLGSQPKRTRQPTGSNSSDKMSNGQSTY